MNDARNLKETDCKSNEKSETAIREPKVFIDAKDGLIQIVIRGINKEFREDFERELSFSDVSNAVAESTREKGTKRLVVSGSAVAGYLRIARR